VELSELPYNNMYVCRHVYTYVPYRINVQPVAYLLNFISDHFRLFFGLLKVRSDVVFMWWLPMEFKSESAFYEST
jgi:hypothetical protein